MVRFVALMCVFAAAPALAQYNFGAGKNAPAAAAAELSQKMRSGELKGPDADRAQEFVKESSHKDNYGNAAGSQYDLAVDGAFEGQTILVIDLYHPVYELPFNQVTDALKKKGFNVVRYSNVPPVAELKQGLAKSNQFWIISNCTNTVALSAEHQKAVKAFFDAGHGIYLWGDNDPCNADADALGRQLVDATVKGDLPGDQTVGISRGAGKPGIVRDHLLSTGVETVYEGVTVATVTPAGKMTPVIYGSAGNLIAAAFEANGKRLLIDGGFTRLQYKWDSAGTGRYIANAAAWLANYERFGSAVVAEQIKKK